MAINVRGRWVWRSAYTDSLSPYNSATPGATASKVAYMKNKVKSNKPDHVNIFITSDTNSAQGVREGVSTFPGVNKVRRGFTKLI